jgi:hypothetical protein
MKKNILFTVLFVVLALHVNSQNSAGDTRTKKQVSEIFISESYDDMEQAYKQGQLVLSLSPPFFSYPTYRSALENSREFNGIIPPSFMNYNISFQGMLSNWFAFGITYKFSHFRINDTYLPTTASGNYETTNVSADVHNVFIYGRIYYHIHPIKGGNRGKFGRNIFFSSGVGIGVGKVNWQSQSGNVYKFFAIPGCENLIYQIDLIGLEKPLGKHFVWSMSGGYGSNGIVNMAIHYKIFTNHL